MSAVVRTSKVTFRHLFTLALVASIALAPSSVLADKKKKKDSSEAQPASAEPDRSFRTLDQLDYSKIIWPNPPAPTRLKYLNYFSSQPLEKIEPKTETKKKSSWMERMAGGDAMADPNANKKHKLVFVLSNPYGMAVDHSGKLYVADSKVGAIFVFNTETKDCDLIKSGDGVRFGLIVGLAIDDDDTLYVSDGVFKRVLIYDRNHRFVTSFNEGMTEPAGLALDTENRQLYVVDTASDQVLVYDADSHKLIRKIGTAGKKHTLTSPGNFGAPTNAAVDKDGNLYVTDTWNDRVEVFDADGNFIRAFGKNGDAPGKFTRPKGIAIDSDGHVWVADAMQDTLQVFTAEGDFLMRMGGHGALPGKFSSLAGLTIDRNNRIFTSEIYPGRVQMFRYFTEAEAKAQLERQKAEEEAKTKAKAASAPAQTAAPASAEKAADAAK